MVLNNSKKTHPFTENQATYSIKKFNNSLFQKASKEFSFDEIKAYIERCPASKDPNSRIIIKKTEIYFGCSLQEIEASFPRLPSFIMTRAKSFSEENIRDYGLRAADANFSWTKTLKEEQDSLKKNAREYFSTLKSIKTAPKKTHLTSKGSPKEVLLDLIEHHDTLAIGEVHTDKSSKKLLIDNMALLKAKGVDVIYLEHVFDDTQKELFESYFASEHLEMPCMLKEYLQRLDRGFGLLTVNENFLPYSFQGLVMQAKRHGIKIIPIDTVASYSTSSKLNLNPDANKDTEDRCLMMNYVAAKQYSEAKSTHNKALFFVGSKHINAVNSGISGIAEITQGATLVIQDKDDIRQEVLAEEHIAKPDAVIYMTAELSDEAKQLQSEYQSILEQNKLKHNTQLMAEKNTTTSTNKQNNTCNYTIKTLRRKS